MAHDLAQGDGPIGVAGMADRRAIGCGQGPIQGKHFILHQLHHPNGGDHFGDGGHLEHRFFGDGCFIRLITIAMGIGIEPFAALREQENAPHRFAFFKKRFKKSVRLRFLLRRNFRSKSRADERKHQQTEQQGTKKFHPLSSSHSMH